MMHIDMKLACCRPLTAADLSDDEITAASELFQLLADPARLKIINLLASSDQGVCACDFQPELGLTQATVSHHLKKLTDAGLLHRKQLGKWACFTLNREATKGLAELLEVAE
jgi:ArsR family transcriptional regulator